VRSRQTTVRPLSLLDLPLQHCKKWRKVRRSIISEAGETKGEIEVRVCSDRRLGEENEPKIFRNFYLMAPGRRAVASKESRERGTPESATGRRRRCCSTNHPRWGHGARLTGHMCRQSSEKPEKPGDKLVVLGSAQGCRAQGRNQLLKVKGRHSRRREKSDQKEGDLDDEKKSRMRKTTTG